MEIYHNARCSKSREALSLLEDAGKDVTIVEYTKKELSRKEVERLVTLLKIKPYELLRRNEKVFKEEFKGKSVEDTDWIGAMVKYPSLIERPIVIDGDKAVIGRPPSRVLEL